MTECVSVCVTERVSVCLTECFGVCGGGCGGGCHSMGGGGCFDRVPSVTAAAVFSAEAGSPDADASETLWNLPLPLPRPMMLRYLVL